MEPPALPRLPAWTRASYAHRTRRVLSSTRFFLRPTIMLVPNRHLCNIWSNASEKGEDQFHHLQSKFFFQLCFLFPCLYLTMYNLHIPLYNRPLQFWSHYHFEAFVSQISITSVKYKVEVFTCWCLFMRSSDFWVFKYFSFWRGWHGTRDKWSAHFRTKSFCSKTKFFPLSRDKSFLNLPHILSAHLVMTLFWKLLFLCVGLVCKNPYMVLI